MSEDGKLDRTLTLQDLTLFGISSALGSGGITLIGKALRAGGSWWPPILGGVSILFMGISWVYSRVSLIEGSNTAETDIIARMFGDRAASLAGGGLLLFHVAAIAVSLVFVSQTIIPSANPYSQIGLSTLFLACMTWFSLSSIEFSKEIIMWTSWALLVILFAAAGLGGAGLVHGLPHKAAPSAAAAIQSLMYFVFIFAGAEVLAKFSRESNNPSRDIPIAFFTTNAVSAIAVLGIAVAVAIWVPGLTVEQEGNAIGHLFARFVGTGGIVSTNMLMNLFVLITTFIMFLATSRYLHGVGEDNESFRWLTDTNAAGAPWKAAAVLTVACFLSILINNTDVLVKISDSGLLIILGLVSAAAALHDWAIGESLSGAISTLTAVSLGGVLGAAFM
jgi:amino acid transporter